MDSPVVVAEAPSTATVSAPQVSPEATPQKPTVPQKPLNLNDRVNQSLQKAREKLDAPKAESVPKEEVATEPTETKTEETVPENTEALEVVSFNGQEAPISEVLKDADFEVFANGEFKKVEGIDKLMDMASIGFAATRKVEAAKTVIQKSQEVIREIEATAKANSQKIATDYLNNLLDQVTNGKVNPATGQPFKNEAERLGAVELANSLIKADANGARPGNQPLTAEDIQKLVEEAADKKYKQTEAQKAEQRNKELAVQLTRNAEDSLQKEITPLMQYFTGEDGKTLNTRLFNSFKKDVQAEADNLFNADGKKTDSKSIASYISRASKSILQEYLPSLKTQKVNESVRIPATSTTSGMPIDKGKPVKYKSREEAINAKVKAILGAQGQV